MPKPPRQKLPKGSRTLGATPDSQITDPRFTNIQTDPRFRLPSRKTTHVKIDKRFAHMLRDDEFSSKAKVDRYGRKLPKDAGTKDLQRYYRIEDEEDPGHDGEVDDDEEVESELKRANDRNAEDSTSSSEESSSDEDDLSEAEEDEIFGFPDEQDGEEGIPMGEPSARLAVVNLDWDNIRATDLMAVFSSFTPANGRILKVSIYPSAFGRERMEREEMEGPPKEIFAQKKLEVESEQVLSDSSSDEESNEEDDEKIKKSILKEDQGEEFNSAKLRRYQLERLRYYYAVLTCSSIAVAQAIYDTMDGTEYLTTANFFDLRFIPDEVEFVDENPREECERIPDGYRPNEFVTDALQHSKVRLTWDADDRSRKEAQKKAFTGSRADLDENDLKAYLGSDSSGEDEPEPIVVDATVDTGSSGKEERSDEQGPSLTKKEAERQKMRALLGLPKDPETTKKSKTAANGHVGDLQVTFSSGLSSEPNKGSVFENEPPRDETTVEKYVRKEKERKARRKEKMKNSRNGESAAVDQTQPETAAPVDKEGSIAPHSPKDLGFADPFFTDPSSKPPQAQKVSKKSHKQDLARADSPSRAELELLMLPEKDAGGATAEPIKHFDMRDIAAVEKALAKKQKLKGRAKLNAREKSAMAARERGKGGKQGNDDGVSSGNKSDNNNNNNNNNNSDTFEMDVQDPRFGAVFDRSEFAIDPTHPRFQPTGGMKKLLEEGRRKREGREEHDAGTAEQVGGNRTKKRARDQADEVKRLVEKVKRRAKT
ncbi:pre-rRNA-processing protein esf1 [Pseudocyphellaria aurata]|nr:pre-rRNA-processing protein esf1 [Pseudocyphellaria aurata]